jgi:hypothetical protein
VALLDTARSRLLGRLGCLSDLSRPWLARPHGMKRQMQSLFSISKMRDDGRLELFAGADILESAKERVEEFGELWPGTYVILNQTTKESFTINIGDDTKLH